MRKQNINWYATGISLAALALTSQASAAVLTPQQVVQKCQQAYDALSSYQGTVHVTTHGSGNQVYHTSAVIAFERPGKIKASGTTMFSTPYAYVSNGTTTALKMNGNWTSQPSAEMAIGGATGIAQDAATTVPALLLQTLWGQPFSPADHYTHTVGRQNIAGHPCYVVNAKGPIGNSTYWIDTKTFLLRRMADFLNMGSISLHQNELMTHEKLNAPIAAATFAVP